MLIVYHQELMFEAYTYQAFLVRGCILLEFTADVFQKPAPTTGT